MKFATERNALLAVLAAAVRIVSSRTTIPILANVLVEAEGDGITVTTTNLDIRMSARVPAEVERPGALTLPAKILHDVVRASPPDARTTLDAPMGERATLRHGRSRQTLSTLPAEDYPAAGVGTTPHSFEITGSVLARQLARCAIAISTEETRFYLCGVLFHAHVDGDGVQTLRTVSTDGHRLVRASIPLPEGASDLPLTIVPREACAEVQRLATAAGASPVRCEFGARLVAFTFPSGLVLTTKTVDGTFPDYGRVIPLGNDKEVLVSRAPLMAAIERVALVRDNESRSGAVRFTADPEAGLTLRVSTPTNEGVEQVDAETAHHFETGFNPSYLLALLGSIDGDMIAFDLGDAGSPALIRSYADAERATLCVLMPMRA